MFFDNFVYWKGLGSKEKMNLPFLRLFDNLLSKYFAFKIIFACKGCFGFITKIIIRSGKLLLHIFRMIFSDTRSMDKVSMSYLFSFSGYQTKSVIKFLFRQLMTSWTLRFIFDHPPKQWPTGRKRQKDRNTKYWISQKRKELFWWNKKHFS